jgi:HAE1 family hydrophobic/amphiphilic exporter-1
MDSLVRFTLRQQVFFNLLFVIAILGGSFAVNGIVIERYPDINMGKLFIETFYPGASPRDVEALVTRKLEDAIRDVEDIEFITANSTHERSTITVKFRDDTDYQRTYDEVRFRILATLDELPAAVEPPQFDLFRLGRWLPVVAVNLIGERSNRALTLLAEQLQTPLGQIPGVAEAQMTGEQTQEFHIALNLDQLRRFGLTFETVATSLQEANLIIPAGDYTDQSGEFIVRVDERFRSREQVLETVLRRDADGSLIRVADVISSAELTYRDPHVISSVNAQDAVTINILKNADGNSLDIYQAVTAVLAEFEPMLANAQVKAVLTEDSTTYIRDSMSTLGWNMILGIILVGLILWFFMGSRNAGLVTIGIPFSFLVTMIIMHVTGNSLNEITLFSFVLVSGIIVDDAVVVVENIYRHVEEGRPLNEAIIQGTSEVMFPVIAATATTAVAFLPMLLMSGSTGEFFALIPKAIVFAITASLFECLFILPLHYLDFGPRLNTKPSQQHLGYDERILSWLRQQTIGGVLLALRWRWSSLMIVTGLFISAVAMLGLSVAGIVPFIRIQFFPDDYNIYYAFVEAPPGTAIELLDERVRTISSDLIADGSGYARSVTGFAGFVFDESYEKQYGHHLGTVKVALPAKKDRAFSDPVAYLDAITARVKSRYQDDLFKITVRAEKDGPPAGKDINIRIVGNYEPSIDALATALTDALAAEPTLAPALTDIDAGASLPARVLKIDIDEVRAQEFGLTKAQVAHLAASVLDGRYLGDYRLADEEIDLKLKIAPEWLLTPEAALATPVIEHVTGPVYLRDVAHLVIESQPGELHRYRNQRSRTITANIRADASISAASVIYWVRQYYHAVGSQYPGASLTFGGEFETTQRSFTSLMQAFVLAIVLIYLILAVQFKSYAQPILILSTVAFSIIGVVFGKWLSQSIFTVNSFIAVVGVTGVVVNDALVLLEFINRRYRTGLSRHQAIVEGIQIRLRPILLTTITTTLGLLPMALGIPSYSIVWGSMASTFVTGLAAATVLTLFIVPVGWDLLQSREERRQLTRKAID